MSFRRAIGNLLNNAIRHAKSHVQIRVERHEDRLAIDVVDDGLGIEAKDRERVFEPFVRLDTQVNNNGNGVGLGLAIVQRIMKLHDGSVEIHAETSGGCTFRTTWPIA